MSPGVLYEVRLIHALRAICFKSITSFDKYAINNGKKKDEIKAPRCTLLTN